MDNVTPFSPDGTDRWADLTTEEIRLLAQEHRENPAGCFEAPPESWPDWTDDDCWVPNEDEDGHELDEPPPAAELPAAYAAVDLAWWAEEAAVAAEDEADLFNAPIRYTEADGPMGGMFGHMA